MSKRLLILACAVALLAAACGETPQAEVRFGQGRQFVPNVADALDDVGLGNAIAVDPDGVPYVSYLGFPEQLEEGEIPVARPIGAPFLPAVLLASVSADGIWTRGAAAMSTEAPAGVTVPFGPDTAEEVVASLEGLDRETAAGTDVAVDGAGALHTVWAAGGSVWYGTGTTSFAAEQVVRGLSAVGRPSVAVDGEGAAWIAFTQERASGHEVVVARPEADGWALETIASFRGEGSPGHAEVVVTDRGPEVLYVDQRQGAVMAAVNDGESGWVSFEVEPSVSGAGLQATAGSDGTIWATYYTGAGEVHLAASSGTGWTTSSVARADEGEPSAGPEQTTGVAVDDEGTLYVAWRDAAEDAVLMASGPPDALEPVETRGTHGGAYPSVGVAPDGSKVYLAWYATETQDLLVGIVEDVEGLVVAEPSPTTEPGTAAPTEPPTDGGAACEPSGTNLTIVATGSTWDTDCLAVEAGTPFSVTLENQDPIPHDFSIYPSASELTEDAALFYSFQDPQPGSGSITYPIDPIEDPGDYFFQCDFHPTTMSGTFVVAEAGGGGGQ